jgi:hypothetical protein
MVEMGGANDAHHKRRRVFFKKRLVGADASWGFAWP